MRAENLGVGAEAGELEFTAGRDCMNHVVPPGGSAAGPTVKVAVRTLDEVLGGEAATLMKIDVEGYETLVLRGARKTLANPALRAVIMELNGSGERYGFSDEGIVAEMQGLGFVVCGYEVERKELVVGERGGGSGNVLFVRDLVGMVGRLGRGVEGLGVGG